MANAEQEGDDVSSMSSEVFIQKLEELDKRMSSRFDATDRSRHQANNSQHSILLNLTTRMDKQDDLLGRFQESLADQARSLGSQTDSLRRIETRLVGDASLGSTGLSQEVNENKGKLHLLTDRVGKCEDAIADGEKDRAQDRRIVLYMVGIFTALGGIVTWLKATGALAWLSKS